MQWQVQSFIGINFNVGRDDKYSECYAAEHNSNNFISAS